MSNKEKESIQLLQGTLDLIVLRTLATMGSQHAYQIATRLQQVSNSLLTLNQGTLYPALVRLEQYGWIKGTWGRNGKQPGGEILCDHESQRKGPRSGIDALAQDGGPCGTASGRGLPAMIYLRRFLAKFRWLFHNAQVENDLKREINAHLGLLEEDFLRNGMSSE